MLAVQPLTTASLLAAICLTGCDGTSPAATRPAKVIISGDTAGWIVPCGCASNQSGGMARRATYVSSLRQEHEVLYLDAGGAGSGVKEYDVAKLQAILRGEMQLQIAAHNIGSVEASLGAEELGQLSAADRVPFVAANLVAPNLAGIVPAHRLVEVAGRRVLVIGILSPQFETGEVKVSSPQAAILKSLRETAGQRDFTIVLAYSPAEELQDLASRLPEVDAIIGGPTGQAIVPQQVGSVTIAAATNKGKFLVELELPAAGQGRLQGQVVEVASRLAEDEEQTELLHRLYAHLQAQDFTAQQTSLVRSSVGASPMWHVAGAKSCRECHADDCAAWDASAHAHAWATLEKDGSHVDSYCQQCHTTGFGLPAGFVSAGRTREHVNVGCESCHGPSQAHVDNPATHTPHYHNAASQCVVCHDADNSPQFEYQAYWAKIKHGAEAQK